MTEQNYSILFTGEYSPEQVNIKEIPSTRKINSELEALCRQRWEEDVATATANGQLRFEGDVYRFEGILAQHDSLSLILSTIKFSIRSTINKFPDRLKVLGSDYTPKGMYSSLFITTKDGKYVFMADAGKYMGRRDVMFIGGVLSRSDQVLESGKELFEHARRECREETGCHNEDFAEIRLRAGFLTESSNICLLFSITLNLTVDELMKRFNEGKTDGEAKNLIFVDQNELATFALGLNPKEHPKFIIMDLLNKDN